MMMVVTMKLTQQSHDTESQASLIPRSVIQSKQAHVHQRNKTAAHLHRVIQASKQRDDIADRDIWCENAGKDCEAQRLY